MPKQKAIENEIILDRSKSTAAWDQVIAEAELQISRLKESVRFFRQQRNDGATYPIDPSR